MNNAPSRHRPSGSGSFNISVSTPAQPERLPPPRPPGPALRRPRPRPRPCRPIDLNSLCPGESVGDVEFLTGDGNFVTLPGCLTSPLWTLSCIPARVAETLRCPIHFFPGDHVQYYATPRGRIPMIRYAAVWFRLVGGVNSNENFSLMEFPVLETETHGNLGVSLIIGDAHIRRNAALYSQSQEVPLGHYVPSQHGENHGDDDMPFAFAFAFDHSFNEHEHGYEHDGIREWLTDTDASFQWDGGNGVARDSEGDQNPTTG
ncbi:uncharacterized protein B0T15DRAFT_278373 [Chaetomium strumarium]|uniref:Uncharacterized protein n=1 Tax=Chaetomium strumarium TaxID=1170767 RepID=A0AAJ0GP35_9PEZI|nr:hypothetical protein B0T15DRAFT_278373 [Chaetomium strumarium]